MLKVQFLLETIFAKCFNIFFRTLITTFVLDLWQDVHDGLEEVEEDGLLLHEDPVQHDDVHEDVGDADHGVLAVVQVKVGIVKGEGGGGAVTVGTTVLGSLK